MKEEKPLVQKTESKVNAYGVRVELGSKAVAQARRMTAEQRKKQAAEPLYLNRM